MKYLLKLVTLILLTAGVSLAQQGLYRAGAPGTIASGSLQSPITSGITWNLCPASLLTGGSSLATCVAGPVAATSDQAGASSITQPGAVPSNGLVQFYAPPGNYALVLAYAAPASIGNQIIPISIAPDVLGNQALNDGMFYVAASQNCITGAAVGSNTGTTSAPDGTVAIDGSVPALIGKRTNASGSHIIFYCNVPEPPSRSTAGKLAVLQDVTVVYSVQTTTATSMVTPTLTGFQAPAAGAGEAASSATLVAFGGTLAMTPVVGSANLTAVSAGQYYTEKIALGTPASYANLQSLVLTFEVDQSASAAQIVSVPGFWVHYSIPGV